MSPEKREFLDQFRLYATDDLDMADKLGNQHFGVRLKTSKPGGFYSKVNRVALPKLSMFYSAGTAGTFVTMERTGKAHVHLMLRGRCTLTIEGHDIEVDEGEAFICSEGTTASISYATDYEKLALIIPPAVLERAFTKLTGFTPKCRIEFEPKLDTSDPRFAGFRDLLLMLAGRLDPALSAWPQATLEQLETACVTALVFLCRNNLSRLLDPTPCAADLPRHMRIAEHFAEINADRDISIGELAKVSAVSASTLTRTFLKHRGCTPTAFIKRTRLERAKALLESRSATTVVGVALRCGFSNPSRFGKDYQQVFGETPSDTLRRLRSQPDA